MSQEKPTIGLVSLGCPKNVVDAEKMLGKLKQDGFKITLNDEDADIVLVNTCSFIKEAEKESIQNILSLTESGKKVVITGCLSQKYKKELQEAIPEAVGFVGTGDYQKITEVINQIMGNQTAYEVSDNPYYQHIDEISRFHITTGGGTYIKIAEGCDYSCAFCVIPSLRGKYNSRTIESIVKEARELGKEGLSEIILIAQDTTNYGRDIYDKASLGKLLEELNKIDEISWIRPMYFYPSTLTDELIDTMAKLDKVVKYIDIPLQHSHPEMLKLMQRPVMDNGKIIEKIRKKIPNAAIRTVFITGFPGETEDHFEHLYEFVKKYKFDKLGVFEYSREKNTPADKLKGHVNAKIKKSRKNAIMELQQGISREINESFIGKTVSSLVETINPDGHIVGRTYRDAPEIDGMIYIKSKEILTPGDVIDIKITDASEYDLYGKY